METKSIKDDNNFYFNIDGNGKQYMGSFESAIRDAYKKGSTSNQTKLENAFPEYFKPYSSVIITNTENSINQNGCSVCEKGTENYTTFQPVHRPNSLYYQYDYRHTNGNLFSTVAPTLEQCRDKRDKWLNKNETNQ